MKVKLLISSEEIHRKIKELAVLIKGDFKKVYCIVVLQGATVFFNDLRSVLKGLDIEFSPIKLSSYKNTESTGKIRVDLDVKDDIKGKDVLIVEDIVDTGLTLEFLKKYLIKKKAKSVKVCSLLNKKARRKVDVKIDYLGFEVPNKFVVGYGIDYNQKYRDLDYIGVLD